MIKPPHAWLLPTEQIASQASTRAAGANTAIDSPAILALWMFCAPRAARQRQACRQQRR